MTVTDGRALVRPPLLGQLSDAEDQGDLGRAARLAASIAGRALRAGHYRVALHWTEWSLQIQQALDSSWSRALWSLLQLRFLLQLLSGDAGQLSPEPPSWPGVSVEQGRWLARSWALHLLAQGRAQEALEQAERCWTTATRREELTLLVNPYLRLLLFAGEPRRAVQVAEQVRELTAGLPGPHPVQGLLAHGIALSASQPDRACQLLAQALPRLSVPWQAQAALYLAHAQEALGHPERANAALDGVQAQLLELTPGGFTLLTFPLTPPAISSPPEAPKLRLRFLGASDATWQGQPQALRLRFAELLALLAAHPEGLSTEQLALGVYGDLQDPACCKTELARLRRLVPLHSRPYRLAASVQADFLELPALLRQGRIEEALQLYTGPLLPKSEAPEIRLLRDELDEALRTAVLERGDPQLLWTLASRMHDDLALWEALAARLPPGDPRGGMSRAHVHSLRRAWGL